MMLLPLTLLAPALFAQPNPNIDRIFAQWNNPESPGCVVGVWKNGKTELIRSYGSANLDHAVANTAQTSFNLSSTSKEFTAAAVLLLAERGTLKLDDPIRKWIPEMPEYTQTVLLRHLLEHTSGIRDYIGLWTLAGSNDDTPLDRKQAMQLILQQKELNFSPGTQFLYSNSNYLLLAEAMQRAGVPLPDFARDNIFGPLGMRNTLFNADRSAIVSKRATGYARGRTRYRISMPVTDLVGDGGVHSTLEDVMRWIQAMGNPPPAFAKIFAAMQTPAKLSSGHTAEYGFGLMIKQYRGLLTWDHVGGSHGYRSDILFIPSEKLGVACLCNTSDASTGSLVKQVADAYLGNRPEQPRPNLSDSDLSRKAGNFRDRETGDSLYLVADQGSLIGRFQSFNFTLAPETPMRFRTVNSPIDLSIEFTSGDSLDDPSFLRVESEIHKPFALERLQGATRPEDLAQFEGEYFAAEVPARLKIGVLPNLAGLGLYHNETKLGDLVFIVPDRFLAGVLNLEFVRDAQGKISGLRLNTGRVRRLLYQKVAR